MWYIYIFLVFNHRICLKRFYTSVTLQILICQTGVSSRSPVKMHIIMKKETNLISLLCKFIHTLNMKIFRGAAFVLLEEILSYRRSKMELLWLLEKDFFECISLFGNETYGNNPIPEEKMFRSLWWDVWDKTKIVWNLLYWGKLLIL